MELNNIEIYSFEDEVWYRSADGKHQKLDVENREFVREILSHIETFYPKAFEKLKELYSKCSENIPYYQYRMVWRFCKCNFGIIDSVSDISSCGRMNFEIVQCPLRGECCFENVICKPKFDSKISSAEERVLKLWVNGQEKEDIADQLCLSIHTVNNHIRNAFKRIGVHSKAELITYVHNNKLWQQNE